MGGCVKLYFTYFVLYRGGAVAHLKTSLKVIIKLCVVFSRFVCQWTVDILMGTNCAPLLPDLFLYLYEADFMQNFSRKTKRS